MHSVVMCCRRSNRRARSNRQTNRCCQTHYLPASRLITIENPRPQSQKGAAKSQPYSYPGRLCLAGYVWVWLEPTQLSFSNLLLTAELGDNTFGSVRPSVRLHYACGVEWSMYGLGLPSAKENLHDTWNAAQDLCLFVSNQETFAIKNWI